MKISASIYSNNDRSLENLIKDLDNYNIDMFHVCLLYTSDAADE